LGRIQPWPKEDGNGSVGPPITLCRSQAFQWRKRAPFEGIDICQCGGGNQFSCAQTNTTDWENTSRSGIKHGFITERRVMQHDYERLHVALQMWRQGESYIRDGS